MPDSDTIHILFTTQMTLFMRAATLFMRAATLFTTLHRNTQECKQTLNLTKH